MESFGKDNVKMFLGDGVSLLNNIVARKSADIAIVDNPFRLNVMQKLWMYSAVAGALKDDGIMVVFDDQKGWEETLSVVDAYYHTIARFHLQKFRPMRKMAEVRSNFNIMNWLTPNMSSVVGSQKEWCIGYLAKQVISAKSRIHEQWTYNSADSVGRAAKCSKPHRGAKGIGMAGFILSHLSSYLDRSDIVVVDPYGGSGTFAIASQILGLTCYSSEIDGETFQDAKTKFLYAMEKEDNNRGWFKNRVKVFQSRSVGPKTKEQKSDDDSGNTKPRGTRAKS